jgi:hypothetical protein
MPAMMSTPKTTGSETISARFVRLCAPGAALELGVGVAIGVALKSECAATGNG